MPPKRSVRNKSAADKKKRKAADAADLDDSPPKKKVYRYYCKAENCTNQAQKGGVCKRHGAKVKQKRCSKDRCENLVVSGGVCIRHGAKQKRCSTKDCKNQAQKGGVCIRHGAKVALPKLCRVPDCTNRVQNGGVCIRHGAKVKYKRCSKDRCEKYAKIGGVCWKHGGKGELKRCRVDGCEKQAQRGGVCYEHGATRKIYLCRVPNCTKQTQKGGLCYRHRNYVLPPQGNNNNMLCGVIEDGGNQRNASAVVEINDNEEGADWNEFPMAIRNRKANVANQTETGLSIENNAAVDELEQDVVELKDTADKSNRNDPQKSSAGRGGGNMKDDTEEDPSEIGLQKEEAEGEKIVNDNEEGTEETPDVTPVDGKGGRGHFETEGNNEDVDLNDVRKNEGINVAFTNDDSSNYYGKNNCNASYWPHPPVTKMANQQVLPNNMNMHVMAAAAPGWDPQTVAAQMTLQNYNNEAIAVAANKSTMLPPTTSNTAQAGNQKRRVADEAADHDGKPPKKKVYKYCCKAENCTNRAIKGGVCFRHGAKVTHKRCSRKGCVKFAVNGGVCIRHGAKPPKRCSKDGCEKQAQKRGVCYRHRNYVPPPQGNNNNILCGVIKDRGNQRNASAVVEISDNEEAADDRNESPMAIRKRKENVADQNKRGLSIEDNPAVDEMGQVGKLKDNADKSKSNHDDPEKSSTDRGTGNLKDDTEEDPSGIELQKEAEGEKHENGNKEKEEAPNIEPVDDGDNGKGGGNFETEGNQEDVELNGVRKNERIDVALTNDGKEEDDEGGGMSEMEKDHGDNMADDDHYEFDAGYDNNGDVFSESHVVPDEIVAVGPNGNEVDRDTEIQRLTAELEKERNQSEHVADKYESVKSQLQAKEGHIQCLHNDIEEMTQEMKEVNAGKADMDAQLMTAATARLQERVDKEAAYRDVERLEAEKEELTEQLKEARSNFEAAETFWTARRENKKMLETEGANVKLRIEVRDLKSVNAALKGQAANAKMMEMRANGRANMAILEVLSLEREKDEVQAANEVLRETVEELRETNEALCNNRFKFKLSSRMKKQERENRTI